MAARHLTTALLRWGWLSALLRARAALACGCVSAQSLRLLLLLPLPPPPLLLLPLLPLLPLLVPAAMFETAHNRLASRLVPVCSC